MSLGIKDIFQDSAALHSVYYIVHVSQFAQKEKCEVVRDLAGFVKWHFFDPGFKVHILDYYMNN